MRVTPSLRSTGIPPCHHYYGGVRPSLPHQYFRPRVVALVRFPFASASWFPQFRAEACVQLTPPIRRPPSAQYCRLPADLSRERFAPPVLTTPDLITTRLRRFACARLLDTHLSQVVPGTFDPTFTTAAFGRSGSDWFETCAWTPIPRGPPSSSAQLYSTA